ncbi:hypothetical protein AVEN_33905-1 [Araneus ventricosus]|uniref:Uncharacterized protein n=1 Tax=Araneus ventricosus TaxID=182803 RepID=A0A4Y2EH21_ARAVE|nr:hypothetical protein AVEN_33905-1 [Araneus ventricosus]
MFHLREIAHTFAVDPVKKAHSSLNTIEAGGYLGMEELVLFRPVLKQHEGYFRTDLVLSNRGQMTRTTPELAPLSKLPRHTNKRRFAAMHDLLCDRSNKRLIFSGIGFQTWKFSAPKPRPYH